MEPEPVRLSGSYFLLSWLCLAGNAWCGGQSSCAGSGRQVAQGRKLYQEKGCQLRDSREDRIPVKEVLPAKNEAEAVAQLVASGVKPPFRCISLFIEKHRTQTLKCGKEPDCVSPQTGACICMHTCSSHLGVLERAVYADDLVLGNDAAEQGQAASMHAG